MNHYRDGGRRWTPDELAALAAAVRSRRDDSLKTIAHLFARLLGRTASSVRSMLNTPKIERLVRGRRNS